MNLEEIISLISRSSSQAPVKFLVRSFESILPFAIRNEDAGLQLQYDTNDDGRDTR